MRKYDLIIFDFDDTLFDYEKTEKRALQEAFQYYSLDFKDEYYDIFKEINRELWKYHNTNNALSTAAMKIERFEKFLEKIHINFSADTLSITYTNYSQTGDIINGVEEVIRTLSKDCILVIASNGPCTPRVEKLRNSPIDGKLKFYSSESFEEHYSKPDSRFFDLILKNYKVSRDRILVVGDKLSTDILCANRSNLDSVLFLYRNHNEKNDEAKPKFKINDFKELLKIVYE